MISALIFDKDGTLFDFTATWGGWARSALTELSRGDAALAARLAAAMRYDPQTGRFAEDSTVIAGTTAEVADLLARHLPGRDGASVAAELNALSAQAPQVPAVDLPDVLGALRGRGLRLGLATNDSEAAAAAHLAGAGVADLFDFVAGYDSGHGAKPGPGQLLAFTNQIGVAPDAVAMVGDSLHDAAAARAAGMAAVGVLTGVAPRAVLEPAFDIVLPHIGALPEWLDARR